MKRSIGIIAGIILAACLGESFEQTVTFLFIAFLVWPFLAAFCKLLGKAAKRRPEQPEYATRQPEPVPPAPVPLTVEERVEQIGRAYAERRRLIEMSELPPDAKKHALREAEKTYMWEIDEAMKCTHS